MLMRTPTVFMPRPPRRGLSFGTAIAVLILVEIAIIVAMIFTPPPVRIALYGAGLALSVIGLWIALLAVRQRLLAIDLAIAARRSAAAWHHLELGSKKERKP